MRLLRVMSGCLVYALLSLPVATWALNPAEVMNECPAELPHADIKVTVHMFDPPVYRHYSFAELDRFRASQPSVFPSDQIAHTYGLKSGPLVFAGESRIESQTNPITRKSCYWYTKLNLVISLKPEIYLAKEIKPGSCYDGVIMKHELQHADIDRQLLREYQPIITKTLTQYVTNIGMMGGIPAGQDAYAYQRFEEALNKQVDVIHRFIEPVREARQGQIDTLQSYEATAAPCRHIEEIPH